MAWCPGYIPAIYRAGLRIGATPPANLGIVQRINAEAIEAGEDSDEMRFVVFGTMLREDQLELESEWKAKDLASYNRACKAAFAAKE